MNTVILTGVTGFLGSHLIQELTKSYNVRCLVRPGSKLDDRPGVEYYEIDVTDPQFSDALFDGIFAVVHLLSIRSSYHPHILTINVDFTRKLVNAALASEVQKFIYISSETVQLPGEDLYTRSKKLAEEEVIKYQNYLILRPTVIYGERDRSNIGLLIKLVKHLPIVPIIGNGKQLMQPIAVGDVSKCTISGLLNNVSGVHLIAGQYPLKYIEIVETISKSLGKYRIVFPIPISVSYFMARLFELLRIPILQKSQVANMCVDKEYSVGETEKIFGLKFSDPRVEIARISK